MMTMSPSLPASVTCCPLGDWVKIVPVCGRSSMVAGCPFLNSTVTRSYPVWDPVRIASTRATNGDWCVMIVDDAVQMNAPVPDDAVGLGLGEADGAGDGLGVACVIPPGMSGRPSGLATNSTPTRMTAITAATRAAIQP